MIERILRDDTGVAEPSLVWLNTTGLCFAALKLGSLNDLSVLVTDGFGCDAVLGEKFYDLGLLGIAVEVLTLDTLDAGGLCVVLRGTTFYDDHLEPKFDEMILGYEA